MKRKALLLLSILMLTLWPALSHALELRGYDPDAGYVYVTLGRCPQDEDGGVRDILWRVLSVREDEAYLYSEYILFNHRVHEDDEQYEDFGGQWNRTELYALLHDEKLDEWFTPKEKALLSFSDELGYLFLPTGEDLKNRDYGFGSNKARQGYGTPYALANGLFKYSNGSSPYWTRSQSATKAYGTRCTKVDGRLGYIRCVVMNEGVRPAVRLSLADLEVTGGSGTAADPYRLLR